MTVQGYDLDKNTDEIKSITSIVPQSLAFYPLLTASENLAYFGTLYGLSGKRLKERIEFSINVASLQSFLHKRAGRFSGGMQRRLNLAIGLLNDPRILYLDEPTVGVDAQSRQYMLDMIRKINIEHRTTIIYTSHYMNEIEQISDDIVIIDNGSIILQGKKEQVLSSTEALMILTGTIDAATMDIMNRIEGVSCDSGSICIEKNRLLHTNIIHVLSVLQDKNIRIIDIQHNTSRLEELYLRLTSKQLRDME